jgi:2-polyprenyl-3-methyl-5-hydroxy-6-metoxy-1,4-benzoquinol methylase
MDDLKDAKRIAQEWDDHAESDISDPFHFYNRNFIDDVILKEIGLIENKEILDLGCGNGDFTYKLKDKGANVLGIDISPQMYQKAKQKYPNVDFELVDFTSEDFSHERRFDVIVLELVVMFVNDIDALLENINKVMKEDSKVIIAIIHPFFMFNVSKIQSEQNMSTDVVDDYFVEKVLKLETKSVDFTYFSRSVSWYVKKFHKNNFDVIDISEPEVKDGIIELDTNYTSLDKIPYLMLFKLERDK